MKADEFKKKLKEADLTIEQLADVTGYSNRQMFRFQAGDHPIPEALAVLVTLFAAIENIKRNRHEKRD